MNDDVPLAALSGAIGSGRLSSGRLVADALEFIARSDDDLRAFISLNDERARAQARRCDESAGAGVPPLHGIPFSVKDVIHTEELPTTAGSAALATDGRSRDATVVRRLRDAGAILLGKNTLHEWACGITGENDEFGTAVNPWKRGRLAGGSSSGCAAAVASGSSRFAIGTDTGGSVRVPAALCGLTGLKPTFGRISRNGVIPFAWSLDHVGILGRSAADVACILGVVAGPDGDDAAAVDVPVADYPSGLDQPLTGMRIGVDDRLIDGCIDPEIAIATRRALASWSALGVDLVPVELPDMKLARTAALTIQLPEALSYHRPNLRKAGRLYGPVARSLLVSGQFILAEHYVQAQRVAHTYCAGVNALLRDVDVIVTPGCPVTAPRLGVTAVDTLQGPMPIGNALTLYTSLFNMTGHPAVVTPSGLSADGLPMSVQIIGRAFEEATVLRFADWLERTTGRLRCPYAST